MANSGSGDSVVDRVVRVIAAFPEGSNVLQLTELATRAEANRRQRLQGSVARKDW